MLAAYAACALVLAYWLGTYAVDFTHFCREGQQAAAARAAGTPGVLDSGQYTLARPDESIALCWNRHCPELPTPGGNLVVEHLCHEDLGCYCVPRADAANTTEIARRLRGNQPGPTECTVVAETPTAADARGPCPRAHCLAHLER